MTRDRNNSQAYMAREDQNLIPVYQPAPVVLEYGEGVYLYDTEGKKYLDFASGVSVCGLGYHNEELNQTLNEQTEKLWHTSNLYYNTTCGDAAAALKEASGMDRVFFTNSGTEAIEGALKTARKYAVQRHHKGQHFLAMEGSFHGRTLGALSVTAEEAYRKPFEPLVPGVAFARFNQLDSVKESITEETCAVILEPIQGEGGIHVADQDFLRGVRKLCDQNGILLIFDEIQCGMARTGSLFAWQHYGVKPDILVMAKGIGNGFPVGAFAVTEEVASHSLVPGDHGTTYGGNPLACAVVNKTLEIYQREDLPGHVRALGPYLSERLEQLTQDHDAILEHRGFGFLQGLKMKPPVQEVIDRAREAGLLLISAKENVLRIAPPLIATKAEIEEGMEKLEQALD